MMRISDLENQSMVGTVIVLEAIATELLAAHLRRLKPEERDTAVKRMTGLGTKSETLIPQAIIRDRETFFDKTHFQKDLALSKS